MSRYRKIETRTWSDEKFRALSPMQPSGQALWFFLLTGPHTGPVPGMFRAGRAAMAEELDWEQEAFDEAFREAFDQGMVKADFKARFVWLPNAVKYNPPESPNVATSWGREAALLPECALRDEAVSELRQFLKALNDKYLQAFDKAYGKPSLKPSAKPSPNQEQEQEQEQEQDKTPTPPSRVPACEAEPEPDPAQLPEFQNPAPVPGRVRFAELGHQSLPADWQQEALQGFPELTDAEFAVLWPKFVAHFADGNGSFEAKTPDGWVRRWVAWVAGDAHSLIADRKRRDSAPSRAGRASSTRQADSHLCNDQWQFDPSASRPNTEPVDVEGFL